MIKYYDNLTQGTEEWFNARCGMLTASEMKLIITPAKLKIADNDNSRSHLYELLAQRISKHVEASYLGDDMLRGQEDEIDASIAYNEKIAPVERVGFITNDKFGFHIGYSPDGLVGDDGLIECKSRRQKFQIQTIIDSEMPNDFLIQVQTGLLVSERKWCDFISYSAGLPMITIRIEADSAVQEAIISAATEFEKRLCKKFDQYIERLKTNKRLIQTERRIEREIHI